MSKLVRGFTLIEMVIYSALLVILLLAVVQFSLSILKSYKNIKSIKNVESSAITAFERMTRDIRVAKSIDIAHSALGSSPGDLVINTTDDSGSAITEEFYVNNGVLSFKSGGTYQGPLMATGTVVSNLVFRRIATSNSEGVKIEMEIVGSVGNVSCDRKFYSTVSERGTY